MNFAASLGCTAVGLRPPSVAPQARLKPTTETRQRSTYKKAKAVQTNGATSLVDSDVNGFGSVPEGQPAGDSGNGAAGGGGPSGVPDHPLDSRLR